MDPNTSDSLARHIYGELKQCVPSDEYLSERAILAVRNDVVHDINGPLLDQLPGEKVTLLSNDETQGDDTSLNLPIEYLNSISAGSLPPHKLSIKVGCAIMLLRNIDPPQGLCNGTHLKVIRTTRYTLECSILGNRRPVRIGGRFSAIENRTILLPRMYCDADGSSTNYIQLRRKQFPVRVCFAMTINKSQGQSLQKVGILLNHEVRHGNNYRIIISRSIAI